MATTPSQAGATGTRASDASRSRVLLAAAATLAAVVVIALFVLYARGGGPVPRMLSFLSPGPGELLAASGPEETVLRSLRLAGIERAVAGEERGTALVRIEIPSVSSAGDFEIAWQTGMASLAAAYPRADEYVVQLFAGDSPLAQAVAQDGDRARAAIEDGDAAALRELTAFAFLIGEEAPDE